MTQLNPELHPVGTEFIGHRWEYYLPRRNHDEFDPIGNVTHSELFDPDTHSELFDPDTYPGVRKVPSGVIQLLRVLEYSPSGRFVKLNGDDERDDFPAGHATAGSTGTRGHWRTTSRYEVLEIPGQPGVSQ